MNYDSPAAIAATIAALRAKLRATTDEASKAYYRLCIAGWERWLKKIERATR